MLFQACSIKKRTYRSGYYIEWKNHAHPVTSSEDQKKKSIKINYQETSNAVEAIPSEELASTQRNVSFPKKNNPIVFTKDECNDLITMKNGDEIKVKVIEISEKQIKYKRCDNLEGPLITVNKYDVFSIKYANGTKEIFKEEKPLTPKEPETNNKNNSPNQGSQRPKLHILAVFSILCATVGFFVVGLGPIAAIIFGAQAIKEINLAPDRYYGKGLAIAGIAIAGLIILLLLLALIFVILGF